MSKMKMKKSLKNFKGGIYNYAEFLVTVTYLDTMVKKYLEDIL